VRDPDDPSRAPVRPGSTLFCTRFAGVSCVRGTAQTIGSRAWQPRTSPLGAGCTRERDEALVAGPPRGGYPAGAPRALHLHASPSKVGADPLARAWSAAIAAQGEKLLETANLGVSFPAAGNKGRVVADRLYLLGMLHLLAPDHAAAEKWARRAEEELLAVSKMTWSESSFLQLAGLANGVAIGYGWTYDALTPATRTSGVRALHEKAVLPATLACRKKSTGNIQSWWRGSSSNWNLVSRGSRPRRARGG